MKNVSMKNRILWTLGSIAALCFFYMVCRFILFDLHGMKEFPFILLILGLIPIIIASFTISKRVMICSAAGYIFGFVMALLFNSDTYQHGGARYNNLWKIWIISYLIIIALGILWEICEIIFKYINKRNTHEAISLKNVLMKNRMFWTLGSLVFSCLFYIVCRFILFDLHVMDNYSFALFILGLIPIFIASFTYSKRVMICSVAGYIISFVIALLFNSDYYEQGTRYNDGWKIWTISYLIIIALGILWEVYAAIIKYRKKRNAHVD